MPYLFAFILFFITCCSVELPGRKLTSEIVTKEDISTTQTSNKSAFEDNLIDKTPDGTEQVELSEEQLIIAENERLKGEKPDGLFESSTITGYPFIWSVITHYRSSLSLVGGSEVSSDAPELSKSTVLVNVGGYTCTGTLIGPRTVITAAHCLAENASTRFTPNNTKVGFGSVKSSLTYINAKEMSIYPDYDYSGSYTPLDADGNCTDYGFLTLEEDPPISAMPISILPEAVIVDGSLRAILAGWGRTASGGFAQNLMSGEANLNVIDPDKGSIFYGDETSTRLDNGDSGGPLYYIDNGLMYLYAVNSATATLESGATQDFACDVRHITTWLQSEFE
jgi:hypothetical protein